MARILSHVEVGFRVMIDGWIDKLVWWPMHAKPAWVKRK